MNRTVAADAKLNEQLRSSRQQQQYSKYSNTKYQQINSRSNESNYKHINHQKEDHEEDEYGEPIQIVWKNLPLVILFKIFANLSPSERLTASSACSSWRNVIYHSSLWPQKNLRVNLCPHKFICRQQDKNDSGFSLYHLRDIFLYQRHLDESLFKLGNNVNKKPNRKDFNEQLKTFIQKCSRFLNGITFYFDPNSSQNVLDLIKIIKFLSENEVAIYELNENRQNYHANCVNLKHFAIIPVTTLVRCASDLRFMSLYSGLTEAIRFLFSKCNQLEHVSLGNLHELIHSTDAIFQQFLKTGVNHKLQCLHLSSIKGDIFRYVSPKTNLNHLETFECLKHLSLDFDALNTSVVEILSDLNSLKTLSINVHRYNGKHPGISPQAWDNIASKLPTLTVTLNLLHTESIGFKIIIDSLLNTPMPLKHFRAYYLEFRGENSPSILCNMLDVLSRVHQKLLESVILVDNISNVKVHLKAIQPNVLVMLCWRCKHLNNLTVIGYEITDIDLIAMARLRGDLLQGFRFPASCIMLSPQFTSDSGNESLGSDLLTNYDLASFFSQRLFKEAVSKPLKRKWHPIPNREIADIISTPFLPQITYHRTIIEQNERCGH